MTQCCGTSTGSSTSWPQRAGQCAGRRGASRSLRLYHLLRTAPAFRFAGVAWKAGNIPAGELHEFVDRDATGRSHLFLDCVLDDALHAELGAPESFVPFREGYVWHPYGGEVYRPLGSTDQPDLTRVKRELFAELFRW